MASFKYTFVQPKMEDLFIWDTKQLLTTYFEQQCNDQVDVRQVQWTKGFCPNPASFNDDVAVANSVFGLCTSSLKPKETTYY